VDVELALSYLGRDMTDGVWKHAAEENILSRGVGLNKELEKTA
jgi:hypothetical protein